MRSPVLLHRIGAIAVVAALAACTPVEDDARRPRSTLVLGIDVSGSFETSGSYEDAIEFASHYLYGHLNGLGELSVPSAVFVGSVGGERPGETKSFQPVHAFQGKSPEEIGVVLRELFPSQDGFTDFNAFFDRVATLVKRQGLILAPLNIVVLSDGIPDLTARDTEDESRYFKTTWTSACGAACSRTHPLRLGRLDIRPASSAISFTPLRRARSPLAP